MFFAQKTPDFGPKNRLRIWGVPPSPPLRILKMGKKGQFGKRVNILKMGQKFENVSKNLKVGQNFENESKF